MIRSEFAPVVSGYELGDFFSIIKPIERTNLILNPSFETNSTGYTANGSATLVRTTETQRRGTYSLKVKPGLQSDSGIYYTTSALVAGSTYAFSLDVNIRGGRKYTINAFDGVRTIVSKKIVGKGYWERIYILFLTPTNGAHRLYLQKDNVSQDSDEFFTDGWQLELCESGNWFPTTYIDGDQTGFVVNQQPPAYYWLGVPHASQSVRSGLTRSGGQIVNLKQIGFRLLSIIGLGIMPLTNISTAYGLIDGSFFERTVGNARQFSLVGAFTGKSLAQVQRQQKALEDLVKPDLIGLQQPFSLRYQYQDSCGESVGEALEIACSYSGGLEGQISNLNQSRVPLSLVAFDPNVYVEGFNGQIVGYQTQVPNATGIIKRSSSGVYSALGTGALGTFAIISAPDGSLYVGGVFASAGGVANTANIAKWDGTQWVSIGGTGSNASVFSMAVGPDGSIYVGGDFTVIGGVAAVRIARFNGTTWSALGTGALNNSVKSIVVGSDGSVYAGGSFTQMGGIANTSRIAKWNGSAWAALGTGALDNQVNAIASLPDGSIYAGGSFTQMGGIANTPGIAKWNGSAWSALSTGVSGTPTNDIRALLAKNGILYVGGLFTSIGGVAVSGPVAKWNGSSWSTLSNATFNVSGSKTIEEIVQDIDGSFIFGGSFTSINGLTFPDSIARFNGTSWDFMDVDIPSVGISINTMFVDAQGSVYLGYTSSGTATVASVTSVNNIGSGKTYPSITMYGPGRVYQIINTTTGAKLYFNLTLLAGEIATLVTQPGKISFSSNVRANLLGTILPTSSIASFYLSPGVNNISIFATGSSSTTQFLMCWRVCVHGLTGSIRG